MSTYAANALLASPNMPSPPEAGITVPVVDASVERDLTLTTLKLPEWLIAELITYTAYLQNPRFWHGTQEQIEAALDDVGEGVIQLMLPVESDPELFDPSFQITGDDLFWRYNDTSEWINIGEVKGAPGAPGAPGEMPEITVEANTLAPGSLATATIEDYHITFGIPRGNSGSSGDGNLWELPTATTEDMACAAAVVLADTFADRLQDNMELIDYLTTTLAQAADAFLDALSGFIPFGVPTADAVVEFSFEGITEPAIDFVRENAFDIQARALARDQIFCAILASESYEDFWGSIDWWEALPVRDFDFSDPLTAIWGNLGEWITFIANTTNGTNCGWFILAFGAFMSSTIDALIDIDNSAKNMIAYALNTASYRDETTCNECPDTWEQEFDFTVDDGGWTPRLYPGNSAAMAQYSSGNGWINILTTAPNNSKYQFLQIVSPTVAEAYDLTDIEVYGSFSYDATGSGKIFAALKWTPTQVTLEDWGETSPPKTWSGESNLTSVLIGATLGTRAAGGGNPAGSGTITSIILRGTGVNPFE